MHENDSAHGLSRRHVRAGRARFRRLLIARPALALQRAQPPLGTTAESPMGPFYPLNPLAENDADLTRLAGHADRAQGTVIELTGRVLDLRGNPISGAPARIVAGQCGRPLHARERSRHRAARPRFPGLCRGSPPAPTAPTGS